MPKVYYNLEKFYETGKIKRSELIINGKVDERKNCRYLNLSEAIEMEKKDIQSGYQVFYSFPRNILGKILNLNTKHGFLEVLLKE